MNQLAWSVVLCLVSALAYAGGAVVQERVAAKPSAATAAQYAPLRRPAWWAAVVLNGLGGLLHVAALAYGPLSLVQPLGALTIVFALPLAAVFVGRRAGATAWRGALLATVGLAGLLSLTGSADGQSLSGTQRLLVAVVTIGSVAALMVAARAVNRRPAVRSVLLATASGAAFGIASVFTKAVTLDWSGDPTAALEVPTFAVLGVMAVGGLLLSQASYRGAGLPAPLATLTVVNPVVAAAVGIAMFGESFRYGALGAALAVVCGIVTTAGLIMLTLDRGTAAAATGRVPVAGEAQESDAEEAAPARGEVPAEVPAARSGEREDTAAAAGEEASGTALAWGVPGASERARLPELKRPPEPSGCTATPRSAA